MQKKFVEFIRDNIEDYNELRIKAEEERNEFRIRYPLEKLKELKLEDYDRKNHKYSFMNMLENHTNALGSGHLGYNQNKLFYHIEEEVYGIKPKFKEIEENKNLSVQEIFKNFINECYEFIKNFSPDNYYSLNDYAGKKYLHESNVIKGNLISIYCGETPVITSINSIDACKKIVNFLGIPHDANEDVLDLNIKITKYVLEQAPELKKYSLIQLTHVVWKYYKKYIEEKNKYYYVGSLIDDKNRAEEFIKNNRIAIGWKNIGDLKKYNSNEDVERKAEEIFNPKTAKHFKEVLDLFKNIRKGDKVVLKVSFTRGPNHSIKVLRIFAIGEVEKDFEEGYEFIPELGHSLPVRWEKIFDPVKEVNITAMTALQEIKGEQLEVIKSIENDEYDENPINSDDEINGENVIYYGVPGCGKSHEVKLIAKKYTKHQRILFHPDYTYSDFVGQIQPVLKKDEETGKDTIVYKFIPGPFTKILGDALSDKDGGEYCLIIEEINRGNAPAIFGDIFQLLDRLPKDDGGHTKGDSEYRITNAEITKYFETEKLDIENPEEIYIPNNLSIIATMNSSDQNVFPLDTAFKRRWKFKRISNEFDKTHSYREILIDGTNITWEDFVKKINEEIKKESINSINGEDKQIGKYFATQEEINNKKLFAEKVVFYLWEDVVKMNPQALFNTQEYRTLDEAIKGFEDNGIAIFKDGIFNGENDNEK